MTYDIITIFLYFILIDMVKNQFLKAITFSLIWTIIMSNLSTLAYTQEQISSYQWAYDNKITTQWNIDDAKLNNEISRQAAAKMIVNYVENVKWNYSYSWKLCSFSDENSITADLRIYTKKACAYGIMWKNWEKFNPSWKLTKAQLGTIISRLLRWDKYNTNWSNYYQWHLNALKNNWIMNNISNPTSTYSKRWDLIIMLKRISSNNSNKTVSIEDGLNIIKEFTKKEENNSESTPIKWQTKTFTFENALSSFEKDKTKGENLTNTDKLKWSFNFSTNVNYPEFWELEVSINTEWQGDLSKLEWEWSLSFNSKIDTKYSNMEIKWSSEAKFVDNSIFLKISDFAIKWDYAETEEYQNLEKDLNTLKNKWIYTWLNESDIEDFKDFYEKLQDSIKEAQKKQITLSDLLANKGNVKYNWRFGNYKWLEGRKFVINKSSLLQTFDLKNLLSTDTFDSNDINRYSMILKVIDSLEWYLLVSWDNIILVIENIDLYNSSHESYTNDNSRNYSYNKTYTHWWNLSIAYSTNGNIDWYITDEAWKIRILASSKEKWNTITTTIIDWEKNELAKITNEKDSNTITIENKDYFTVKIKYTDKSTKDKIDFSYDLKITIKWNVLWSEDDLYIPIKFWFTLEEPKNVNIKKPSWSLTLEEVMNLIRKNNPSSSMVSAQWRARDVARKNDLSQIQTAIITSQQDRWAFPGTKNNIWKNQNWKETTSASEWLNISQIYDNILKAWLSYVPTDPDIENTVSGIWNNKWEKWEYRYIVTKRNWVENWWFALMAKMEKEESANWIVCNNKKWLEYWYITNDTDLANINTCYYPEKWNSCSTQNCTYTSDDELRYLLMY